jgi:hypothetical protein
MTTLHPRTLARRRSFKLSWQHGKLWKYPIRWTDAGTPIMSPHAEPATIGDILDAAAVEGEKPRELLARLRGADRQWQLDHR